MSRLQLRRGVMETFDCIANEFRSTRNRSWESLGELAGCSGGRALDLGTGTGRNLARLLEMGATEVVAADFSLGMLGQLRGYQQKKGLEGIEVVRCDALFLPFKEGCFRMVSFVATIHHIPGYDARLRAMEEVKRVTEVGGRVLITSWAMAMPHKGRRPRVRAVEGGEPGDAFVSWGDRAERFYHLMPLDELRGLVESAGLGVTKAYVEETSSREEGRNWVVVAEKREGRAHG